MTAMELMHKRRTIRKFRQEPVPHEVLLNCVDCARLSPTSANLQPLRFQIIEDAETRAKVFETLLWAGYIKPKGNPQEGERPMAYIAVVQDTNIRKGDAGVDAGAAMMSMVLAAEEQGLATAWIASVDRNRLRGILEEASKVQPWPENYRIMDVLALGYPAQEARAVPMQGDDVRYWLEPDGTLSVPKRALEDIIL